MKKLLFVGLITIFSACQDNTIQKKDIDYKGLADNLEATYNSAFSVALKSTPDNVYSDTYSYLKTNYFTGNLQLNACEPKGKINSAARISSVEEIDL